MDSETTTRRDHLRNRLRQSLEAQDPELRIDAALIDEVMSRTQDIPYTTDDDYIAAFCAVTRRRCEEEAESRRRLARALARFEAFGLGRNKKPH